MVFAVFSSYVTHLSIKAEITPVIVHKPGAWPTFLDARRRRDPPPHRKRKL